ncbi:uncharacterized protein LOC106469634 [Limulus polyphemus]|uniref:Uncharacterized protein LOC106469634 n=1 Tax=Limulus polyphemus TaxID=6850 RepID=A0ABM1BNJ6_LIMPO|nr:uncharacterized protein LOC106469634 [Limulus polyphemus]
MSDIEMPAEGVDLGLNNGECDVLREKERQARVRAHLVDDSFDINSSSLFFGDPIKVVPQHEDETARRIKLTLGDFNLMRIYLLKDPRRLIGISKTAAFTSNTARCQSENGTIIKSFSVQSSPALSLSSYESAWSPQSPSLPNESYCANSETHLPENFSPLKVEQRCTSPFTSNCCNNSRKSVHYNIITNCQHDEGKAINNFNFSSGDQKQSSLPSKLSEKENDTEKAIHSLPATAIMLHRHTSENNNSTSSLKISTEGRTHQIFCQPINKENTPQRKQTCPILDTTQDQANSKSKRHTDVESILVEMKEVVPFPLTAIATPHREKIVNFSPLRKHVPSSQRNTTNLNKKKKKAHSYPE